MVGMGHLMRCLSIADAAKAMGIDSHFILADAFGQDIILQRDHTATVLNTDYRMMNQELPSLRHILAETPATIVVDSYYASNEYLASLTGCAKVAYMDDWVNRAVPVNYVINYNLYSSSTEYKRLYEEASATMPTMLLGPTYAPLRKGFSKPSRASYQNKPKRIILLVGGTDPERMAMRLVCHISDAELLSDDTEFHLMVGSSEPDLDYLRGVADCEPAFTLHENVTDVAALMSRMDLAISASGTTLYELCACGIPTVCYTLSEDQVKVSKAFADAGAMLHGGDYRNCTTNVSPLFSQLNHLFENEGLRKSLGETASNLVDGQGAYRIVLSISNRTAFE